MSAAVDQKGAVERLLFEVVVGAVILEGVEGRIREQGEGEGRSRLPVTRQRFLELGDGVRADRDEIDPGFVVFFLQGGKGIELLHAVKAPSPEEEDRHDGAGPQGGKGRLFSAGIDQGEVGGGGRAPAEGPEVVE